MIETQAETVKGYNVGKSTIVKALTGQFREFECVQYDVELEALRSIRNQPVGGLTGRSDES